MRPESEDKADFNARLETTTQQLFTGILQAGLAFLLILAPLPFGSVEHSWTFFLEFSTSLLLCLWICHELGRGSLGLLRTGLYWPIFLLLSFILFTLIPLPPSILKLLSPETLSLQENAANALSAAGLPTGSSFRISLAAFDTRTEILKVATYAGFFFMSLHILRHRKRFLTVYALLSGYGALMAVFGLAQHTWSNGKIYWRFESGGGSPFGPFVNHNHFAGYLELTLGLSLGIFAAEVARFRERSQGLGISGYVAWIWHKEGGRVWLTLIGSFLILLGLIASLSRGGALSVLCAGAIFTLFAFLRPRPSATGSSTGASSYRRPMVLGLFGLAVILVALLASSPAVTTRWRVIYDEAAQYRVGVWRDSLQAIQDFPWTGAGLGAFRSLYPRYKSGAFHSETTHAENEYLQWTVETGTLGLAIVCGSAFIYAFQMLSRLKGRRDPYFRFLTGGALFSLLSLSIHNLMDFNLHIPSNALTFAAVAALGLLSVNCHQGRHREHFRMEELSLPLRSAKGASVLGVAIIGVAVLGHQAWAQYQSLRAADEFARGRAFLLRGDPEEGQFDLVRQALEWSRWNDRALFMKASAYETAGAAGGGILQLFKRRGFLEQARYGVLEAIRLRPLQGTYWSSLGRIETAARNREAAEFAFRQALKLAGSDAGVRRDYALSLLFSGETRRGAEQLMIARNYGPNLNLTVLLETVARYTNDLQVWGQLVRNEPGDLKVYSAFLGSRGFPELEAEYLRRATALQSGQDPK